MSDQRKKKGSLNQTAIRVQTTPSYSFVQYKGNQEKGTFFKVLGNPAHEKLPLELMIERTYRPEKIHADSILQDVNYRKGHGNFFTGLRPSPIANFYTGNIRETDGKKSQVIVYINPDLRELLIWYYPKFILFNSLLNQEVNRISKTLPK